MKKSEADKIRIARHLVSHAKDLIREVAMEIATRHEFESDRAKRLLYQTQIQDLDMLADKISSIDAEFDS